MRVTRIGRALGVGVALAVGVGAAVLARDGIVRTIAFDKNKGAIDTRATGRILVYRLDPAHPVQFAFSRPASLMRVMAQPVIDPQSWKARDNWTYGFRVVLRDDDGAEIARHDVYSRALHPDRILPFRRPVRVLRDSQLKVALQSDVILSSDPVASTVEISPLPSDAGVRHIDLRVYERLPFIGRTALSAFRRRSPDEQAKLANASALPAEMLGDNERAALMTNRWRAVGPTGIAGRDYQVFVVYQGAFDGVASEGEE